MDEWIDGWMERMGGKTERAVGRNGRVHGGNEGAGGG